MDMQLMDKGRLKNILESILLVAKGPVSVKDVGKALALPDQSVSEAFEELVFEYNSRGIKIYKLAHGYQFGTEQQNAEYIEKFTNPLVETSLTPPALETLAIIAYKQPITQPEIEKIRGVISDSPIETLLNKKLIVEKGRSDAVGRPYIYVTTQEFLKNFGLTDLAGLPALPQDVDLQKEAFKSEELLVEKIDPAIYQQTQIEDQPQIQ